MACLARAFFYWSAQRTSNKGNAMSLLFDSLYKDVNPVAFTRPAHSAKRFYPTPAPVRDEAKPFAMLVDRVKRFAAKSL